MNNSISYDPWLEKIASISQEEMARISALQIKRCFDLEKKIPKMHEWKFFGLERFKKQASQIKDVEEINALYWGDMANNLEAYSVTVFWRGLEILSSTLGTLNAKEIITPAILARSFMELSTMFIENANIFRQSVERMPPHRPGAVELSEDLEKLLVQIMFGTRLGENIPKEIKAKHINDTFRTVAKIPKAENPLPVYEFLCELAHPNVIGNGRYWAELSSRNADGSETIRIKQDCHAETQTNRLILERILWALGWSAACLRNGYDMSEDVVMQIKLRFPKIQMHF